MIRKILLACPHLSSILDSVDVPGTRIHTIVNSAALPALSNNTLLAVLASLTVDFRLLKEVGINLSFNNSGDQLLELVLSTIRTYQEL